MPLEIRDRNYEPKGRECLCRGCDRVFTSLTGFDAHRLGGKCHDPDTRGLLMDDRGRWKMPMDEKAEARLKLLKIKTLNDKKLVRGENE